MKPDVSNPKSKLVDAPTLPTIPTFNPGKTGKVLLYLNSSSRSGRSYQNRSTVLPVNKPSMVAGSSSMGRRKFFCLPLSNPFWLGPFTTLSIEALPPVGAGRDEPPISSSVTSDSGSDKKAPPRSKSPKLIFPPTVSRLSINSSVDLIA